MCRFVQPKYNFVELDDRPTSNSNIEVYLLKIVFIVYVQVVVGVSYRPLLQHLPVYFMKTL